jgi:hypothetical protein
MSGRREKTRGVQEDVKAEFRTRTHTDTHAHTPHTHTHSSYPGTEEETERDRERDVGCVPYCLWGEDMVEHTHTHTQTHTHTRTHIHTNTHSQPYQLPSAEHSRESRCLTGRVASICCLLPVYLMGNQYI